MSPRRLVGRDEPTHERPTGLGRILEDERFVRGLGLGALIGAAIAGSTLWNRRREHPVSEPLPGAPSHEGPPAER